MTSAKLTRIKVSGLMSGTNFGLITARCCRQVRSDGATVSSLSPAVAWALERIEINWQPDEPMGGDRGAFGESAANHKAAWA